MAKHFVKGLAKFGQLFGIIICQMCGRMFGQVLARYLPNTNLAEIHFGQCWVPVWVRGDPRKLERDESSSIAQSDGFALGVGVSPSSVCGTPGLLAGVDICKGFHIRYQFGHVESYATKKQT